MHLWTMDLSAEGILYCIFSGRWRNKRELKDLKGKSYKLRLAAEVHIICFQASSSPLPCPY